MVDSLSGSGSVVGFERDGEGRVDQKKELDAKSNRLMKLLTQHNNTVRNGLRPKVHAQLIELAQLRANLVNGCHIHVHSQERLFRIDAVENAHHINRRQSDQVRRIQQRNGGEKRVIDERTRSEGRGGSARARLDEVLQVEE